MGQSEAPEVLVESEVTPENIRTLFQRAFYSASIDEDDDVSVDVDSLHLYVTVNDNIKMLRYWVIYSVDDNVPLESKHALVNRMNDNVILCRFSIFEHSEDKFEVDYFLPYSEGVLSFQIVSALRWFARVVRNAIREYDENNLINELHEEGLIR